MQTFVYGEQMYAHHASPSRMQGCQVGETKTNIASNVKCDACNSIGMVSVSRNA